MERIPFRQSRPGRTAIRKPNVLRISMEKKKKKKRKAKVAAGLAEEAARGVEERRQQSAATTTVSSEGLRGILQTLRRKLLNEDRGRECRSTFAHFRESCEKLDGLIRSTIVHGTNNSVLLVGAPGSAKKEVLDSVLSGLLHEFNDEKKSPSVGVVRLSGMLHSDECAALREIARQLCDTWGLSFLKSASFSTNLRFLREVLSELDKGHKTVVFVLDCLDLYTAKQKQGLLYNLLDVLQGSQAQAAVVGLSSRHDCLELMEKRARSRFSYRKVVMPAPPAEEGARVLRELLSAPSDCSGDAAAFNESVRRTLSSEAASRALDRFFKCNATIYTVEELVLELVCSMSAAASPLSPQMVHDACTGLSTLVKQALQFSVLDLTVLVACQRLEKRGRKSYNFHHVYKEVTGLGGSEQRFGMEAALESYLRLVEAKFVEATGDGRRQQEFRPSRLLMMGSEIQTVMERARNCPESLRRAANNLFL